MCRSRSALKSVTGFISALAIAAPVLVMTSAGSASAQGAPEAPQAVSDTTVIGVLSSGSSGVHSFIRIHNNGSAAGTATLLIRDAATGEQLGTWTSPTIPPNASPQYSISYIQDTADGVLPTATVSGYVVDVQPQFSGSVQHVVWSANAGMLANHTRCDTGAAGDVTTLINVHSDRIGGYPSYLRVYNAGATAGTSTLQIYNAEDGELLGTWTSQILPAGAMQQILLRDIQNTSTPIIFVPPNHYVIKWTGGVQTALQQIVSNPNGMATDVTIRCTISPPQP